MVSARRVRVGGSAEDFSGGVSICGLLVRRVGARAGRRLRLDEENTMAKYMLIMRGTDESNAAMMADIDAAMAATGAFIGEMMKAGVLLAAEGLDDASRGVVVDFAGEAPVVTDGPYGETKELFGGYFLLDVASKPEAVEWAKRFPAPRGSKLEVRRVLGEEETPTDDPALAESRPASGSDSRAASESVGRG
jgi:hypothetical protein